jgi:hypothetical protein
MMGGAETPAGPGTRRAGSAPWIGGLVLGLVGGIATLYLGDPVGRAIGACNAMLACGGAVAIIAVVPGLVTGVLVPGWRAALGMAIGLFVGGGIGGALISTPTPYPTSTSLNVFVGATYVGFFGLIPALIGFGLGAFVRPIVTSRRDAPD